MRSPVRAAGPSCLPISSHSLGSYFPVDSKAKGFFDLGRYALSVAYSAVRPRTISTRSSKPSLSSATATVVIRTKREIQVRILSCQQARLLLLDGSFPKEH